MNSVCLADKVGDIVGDIAGMGADLFGSLAEATCAALVIASAKPAFNVAAGGHAVCEGSVCGISKDFKAMRFPVVLSASGFVGGALKLCLVDLASQSGSSMTSKKR